MSRMEAYLQLSPLQETERADEPPQSNPQGAGRESLEFRIGETYMAQAGVIALLLGLGFLVTYLYTVLPPLQSSLGAFLLAGGTFLCAMLSKRYYPNVNLPIFIGGQLLLFEAALRLSYFSPAPLVDRQFGLLAPACAVAFQAVCAVRRKSQFLAIIALLCGYATGLMADEVHLTLCALALTTALAAYFRLKHDWDTAIVIALIAVYLTHLEWLLGNPLLGHEIRMRPEGPLGIPYLCAYALLFAGANLFRSKALALEMSNILLSLFNAGGFCLMGLLMVVTYRQNELALFSLLASLFLLGIAVAYWLLRKSFFSASFYALGGFFAMSMAIFAQLQGAQRFILLAWQSLLVIATAIWFRSKIITVGNLIIFLGIYLFYSQVEKPDAWVNLNFALAAILSARLLNWTKGQVDFKTEFLRNTYLASTFCLFPYGLYLAIPAKFVSLSWVCASIFYFAMSFLLVNRKYRWMGILNFLLVLGRVFLVELASLDLVYRVVSFMGLGLVLLLVSMAYARRPRRAEDLRA